MLYFLRCLLFWVCCLVLAAPVSAHELRPGYLELHQISEHTFDVIWKVPARADRRLALYISLPSVCTNGEPHTALIDNAFVERWRTDCPGGLSDRQVAVDGLSATLTDVLVRLKRFDGSIQIARLTPDQPSFTVSETQNRLAVAKTYFVLGIEHIMTGFDHLLFVLALLLIVSGWGRLLATVTAFTIAHSMTLAAAVLGFLSVPGPPVEAVVALSIMFLASELIRIAHGEKTVTARYPWLIAFTFGLLHGLGFAGALAQVGLPHTEIPLALLMFNVGIEAGQILFLAAATAAIWCLNRMRVVWPGWVKSAPAYGIGTISAFWLIERISGFWQ